MRNDPGSTPARPTRRPAEPIRPWPARRAGVALLSVKARRRRYRDTLPPRADEPGSR